MKQINYIILFILLISPITIKATVATSSTLNSIKIYTFINDDCQECQNLKDQLDELAKNNPQIFIEYIKTTENDQLFNKVNELLKIKTPKVPLTIINSNYLLGADIKNELQKYLDNYQPSNCDLVNLIRTESNEENLKACLKPQENIKNFHILLVAFILLYLIFILVRNKFILDQNLKLKSPK